MDAGELDLINREIEEIMPVRGKGFSEFVNNVHLPYWYKRVRRKSSETDFKVDVPPIKGAQLKSETTYKCPTCSVNLSLYKVFGINVESCPKCKGVFLDKDELRILKDRSQKGSWQTLRWMDNELEAVGAVNVMPSKRTCPKCTSDKQAKLVSTSFGASNIIIDWCPECHGIWLDRDEFQEIVAFLRGQLTQLTSAEMKKKVYEEIKEVWDGPESAIAEILDAKAAIWALINITIFEHPVLCKLLITFSEMTPIR